jgi:drug/metabolite transporter (DMT)-like permease
MDPFLVGLLRTVVAGLFTAPAILFLRMSPPEGNSGKLLVFLSGFGGFVGFPILFSIGQSQTTAIHGGLILACLPIYVGFYMAILERRRPGWQWCLGAAIAIAGEFLLVAGKRGDTGSGATLEGDLLIFAAAAFSALGYVAGALLSQRGYSSRSTTAWGVTISGLLLIPLLPFADTTLTGAPEVAVGGVLFLALGSTIIAYVAWYWALGRGGIARTALFQFLQPVFATGFAVWLLAEAVDLVTLAAAAMILVGVIVARRSRQ